MEMNLRSCRPIGQFKKPLMALIHARAKVVLPLLLLLLGSRVLTGQGPCDSLTTYEEMPLPPALECGAHDLHLGSSSGGHDKASDAFPTQTVVSGLTILVSGTFTIDQDITFVDCVLFFHANADLVTSGVVDLVGLGTVFAPCDNAWNGIRINANGAIRLDNCTIRGAWRGIDLKRNYRAAMSMLYFTGFIQCQYGITALEPLTDVFFSEFVLNSFWGGGTVPGTTVRPRSGIRLVNSNAIIGTPVINGDPSDYLLYSNQFVNLHFGIEAFGGVVHVSNCWFQHMRPEPGSNGMPTGCGINAIGGTLSVSANVQGGDVFGHCEFEKCAEAGIRAANCLLDVRYARSTGGHVYGIASKFTGFKSQTIRHCDFHVGGLSALERAGFYLERPHATTEIDQNEISVSNFLNSTAGIDIRCPVASSAGFEVRDNLVEMSSATNNPNYGIIVYGGQSSKINLWSNTIDHTGTSGTRSFGIFLSSFEGEGNHLLWKNNSFGPAQCNYHLEKSRNVWYCENISHRGRHGFHFYGDNDNSFWSLSDIGRHGTGLLIQDMPNSMGRISEQVRKGNLWQPTGGSYGNYAAHCDGDASLSRFKIEDNSPEKFPTLIEPAMGWFIPDPGPEEVCTGITKPISTFEALLAAGTPPTTAAAEIWDAKRLLIGTLLRHPDLLTEDSVLNAFFLLHTDSTAGKFARLDQMVQEGGFSTSALWAVKDSLMTQFQAVKSTIDSLNARTVLSQLDSNLYYPADSMLPVQLLKWAALADSMDVIEASQSSLHAVVLAQALDSLAAITTTAPYEQAYKTLTSFRIKTAQGLEPEDAGYADLMDLANEDEAVYGGAVRHALHYLPICERYERIAPDETEDTEAERTSGTDARTAGPELILYPNPADNTIWVTQTNLERSTWSIFSTFGTPVRMGIWPEGQPTLSVDLQGIAPGAYYFVARNSAGGTKIGKFVVLR